MERIRINDGSKSYEIVNQEDIVLGVFTFNPTNMDIVEKYNAVTSGLKEAFQLLPEGNEQAIIEASNQIKEKFDELIGGNAAKTFFAITGPLTPLSNGQLFIENVLEAIAQIIEAEMKVRVEKVRSHMNKYTDNYK